MGSRAGFTMIEMVVALFLGLIVLLAVGGVITLNQKAYGWGREKAVLQQNVSETLERLVRVVRGARAVQVVSSAEYRTYDESLALAHSVRLLPAGTGGRIQLDGIDMSPSSCTFFSVVPNGDTTALTLVLELEDRAGNRVRYQTRSSVRNRDLEF